MKFWVGELFLNMKSKIFISILLFLPLAFVQAGSIETRLSGKILLSVEENGEAWYLNPINNKRYFLGRPFDAFNVMQELSLGISNDDFDDIENNVPLRFSGMILLKTEDLGRAYYVNPDNLKLHYLNRPMDAFRIMRNLGLGISKNDLSYIPVFAKNEIIQGNINYDVPFTAQSPATEWHRPVFQDGCEEASALMAISWARNEILEPQAVRQSILDISDWEDAKFGEFRDNSTDDAVIVIKEYFEHENVEIAIVNTVNELIKLLEQGVVIAAMNGQKLGNIYFTAPGPENHMLLIKGYNFNDKSFTTNDPGTRRGEGYTYDENVLFEAIRDYPTGYHLPNDIILKKVILIKK